MTEVLRSLQPRFERAGTIILEEMDECLEIVFVTGGCVAIGFEINKQRLYRLKLEEGAVIGGFNVTFYQRSNYIWKVMSDIEGFFIYKHVWL